MNTDPSSAVPKTHPATREVLPDDPLELHALEIPGDPAVMLQMLVEEFARMGYGQNELMALCRDPFYVGPHGLWRHYGEEELGRRVAAILARSRPLRTSLRESPPPERLVPLQVAPPTGSR